MKHLTTKQLIKHLECCNQDSVVVMRDRNGNLQYLHSIDEDMAVAEDNIWLLSDFMDIAHAEAELLSEDEDYLSFVSVAVLQ